MKTPTTDEVYKWLNDNGIGTGTNLTARSCAEIIRMYVSQFAQPSDVSDEDIDNFIKAHPGNTGNVLMDISVSAGFKEGAKAHRDGKIKKGE